MGGSIAQACYGPPKHGAGHAESDATCPELSDPARSMLGQQQEAWLFDGLAKSQARWNAIGQDVLMAHFARTDADKITGSWTDDWNGLPRDTRPAIPAHTQNPGIKSRSVRLCGVDCVNLVGSRGAPSRSSIAGRTDAPRASPKSRPSSSA